MFKLLSKGGLLFSFIIIFFFHFLKGSSQTLYDTQPLCGKEEQVKKFFRNYDVKGSSIYAVHLKPNSCPRCEGVLLDVLKKVRDNHTCLIVDTKSAAAAKSYLEESGLSNYFTNVIIDTSSIFRNYVDYTKTELKVPYLYKIDLATGTFTSIIPSLGLSVTDSIITQLATSNKKIDCTYANAQFKVASEANDFWDKKILLPNNVSFPFDEPLATQLKNNLISFIDYSSNRIFVFDTTGNEIAHLNSNDSEFYVYARNNFERQIIADLKNQGVLKVIYVNQFVNSKRKNTLSIVASLPKITVDIAGNDTSIGYYNKPVIITKAFNGSTLFIDTLNIQVENDFVLSHQGYKEVSNDELYALKVKKGFPAVGTQFVASDSNKNPFSSLFYKNVPLLKLFNKEGNVPVGYLGRLPEMYQRRKLGYFYFDSEYEANDSFLYVYSEFSGEVQLFRLSDLKKGNLTYQVKQVFPEKDRMLPVLNPDSFSNKLNYMLAYKAPLLSSVIHRIVVTNSDVKVLVFDKSNHQLLVKEYNTDMSILKRTIQKNISNFAIKYLTIVPKKDNKAYQLFGIEENDGKYYMCWSKM